MDDERTRALAREITVEFAASAKLLRDLAALYGFHYALFWQPTTFLEERLVHGETRLPEIDWRMNNAKLKLLYQTTSDLVRREPLDNFTDISGALRDRTEEVYLDSAHLTEEGNAIIARPVADIVQKMFNE
jgi:lysophospholipase L1-like esterase